MESGPAIVFRFYEFIDAKKWVERPGIFKVEDYTLEVKYPDGYVVPEVSDLGAESRFKVEVELSYEVEFYRENVSEWPFKQPCNVKEVSKYRREV